ncbi:class I SAM-dependent methyltransferase [Sulfitobacter aestuariivivens]|uniref:Class I SAM-dependent methyltransferase n=1 Tax=Sulfitobacter aestuariivivens TaxID=2766981 RepID=A0A927D763_9RHOB|nr:class I SAM-dependent methyltransferase [Sulfitobacter aestuariivivens]MBD3665443.1 class I SAM-dependent methyltransferase [Sulfitobacter aestuariivivens]
MSQSRQSGQSLVDIEEFLRCPVTHQPLMLDDDKAAGDSARRPFVAGQPVLVDFENSILDRDRFLSGNADSLIENRRRTRPLWKRVLLGQNRVTPASARQMLELLRKDTDAPLILIIGGGTISDSAQVLYDSECARIISFDVYASDHTDFIADAHAIPLRDESVDAVWVEAVLEHVLSPHVVVDEIWRVLKPGGLVYAGTPFLQPVHERAYDFTRFTENGHRWLFRRFSLIDSGVVAGPGTALFQLLRYCMGALVRNRRLGSMLAAPFFWLRAFDRASDRRHASDAASGVYFLGRRSDVPLRPHDMPSEFRGVRQ